MTTPPWQPFGLSEEEQGAFEVLISGVPDWARPQVVDWTCASFRTSGGYTLVAPVLAAQTACRVHLGASAGMHIISEAPFIKRVTQLEDDLLLRITDYVLSVDQSRIRRLALDKILASMRSAWVVGERMGGFGLVERVPAGVKTAADDVIANSGAAGRLLGRAWAEVHDFEASDSAAYADAVRAVETAVIAVVEPNNSTATLGTVIGKMTTDGDWRLPWRERTDHPTADLVLGNLRALWFGHRDRHGSADYSDVTHEEARAAVALAVSLVDWFASEAVQRR